jgi:uncharacterized membrane protein YccF (DUF307 family)
MRHAGNIIWFVFGGWFISLVWLIGAALFALSVIGLPLTRAAIEIAKMSAFPFGKDVIRIRELDGKGLSAITALSGTAGLILNILWACTFGWMLFLSYIFAGIIQCAIIIGIPFGLQAFKLAGISFWPVGCRVVTKELAQLARTQNASDKLAKLRA